MQNIELLVCKPEVDSVLQRIAETIYKNPINFMHKILVFGMTVNRILQKVPKVPT